MFRSRTMAIFLSNDTFYVICDPRAVIGPNSNDFVWNIQHGYLKYRTCHVRHTLIDIVFTDAVFVVWDFNDNQLNPHCRKVKDIMRLYNLHQLINEATKFTEHSQSLIHLILTNNPSFIAYTEVCPALMDLTVYCPTYGIFSCKKHTSSCYKRIDYVP
jgi:hypothetical protein